MRPFNCSRTARAAAMGSAPLAAAAKLATRSWGFMEFQGLYAARSAFLFPRQLADVGRSQTDPRFDAFRIAGVRVEPDEALHPPAVMDHCFRPSPLHRRGVRLLPDTEQEIPA